MFYHISNTTLIIINQPLKILFMLSKKQACLSGRQGLCSGSLP
jgi:hypothetical protein